MNELDTILTFSCISGSFLCNFSLWFFINELWSQEFSCSCIEESIPNCFIFNDPNYFTAFKYNAFIKPWSWDRGNGKGWGWKNMDSEGRKNYLAKACSPIWPPGSGMQVGVWVSLVHCPCFPGTWLLLHPENCSEGTSKVLKSARDYFTCWGKSAI